MTTDSSNHGMLAEESAPVQSSRVDARYVLFVIGSIYESEGQRLVHLLRRQPHLEI